MSKGTTIKDAISKFEEKKECKAGESKEVTLYAQIPPIEKMDASLSTLTCCEKLSLSTNCIEKIANLNGLKHLKILSLARNNIKSLTGLEAVGDTLEELWFSYNRVEKLKGINVLKKLKVLYMSNNQLSDLSEVAKLDDLPCLSEVVLVGNPIFDSLTEDVYKVKIPEKLKKIKKLDGVPVIRDNDDDEQQ